MVLIGSCRPLAFLLASFFSYASCSRAALVRTATVLLGDITTNRDVLKPHYQRWLLDGWSGQQPHVWVLGLQPHHEAQVHHTLQTHQGQLLHPLPGKDYHHWLVQATAAGIEQLLLTHEDATVALLQGDMKVSPTIKAMISERQRTGLDDISLLVLLPSETVQEHAAFAQLARQQLQQQLGSKCSVNTKHRGSLVRITTCIKGAAAAVAWASAQSSVTWVDMDVQMRVSNIAASAVIQGAEQLQSIMSADATSAPPETILHGAASGFFPLWKAGLTGKNQAREIVVRAQETVAVVDSGVDLNSCFFFDSNTPNVLKELQPLGDVVTDLGVQVNHTSNPTHRKVVEFIAVSGKIDTSGHGTHTAGSVAGSLEGFNAQTDAPLLGTGICPDCKLAVVDAGQDIANNPNIDNVPSEVFSHLQHKVGVRVLSSSIATPLYTYIFCFDIDAAAWTGGSDMLQVYAAGNQGVSNRYLSNSNGTVASPATCKSVIGVGATEGWQSAHENAADARVRRVPPLHLVTADGEINTALEEQYMSQLTLPVGTNTTNPGLLTISSRADVGKPVKLLELNGSKLEFDYAPGWGSHMWQSFLKEAQQFRLVMADPLEGCNLQQHFDNITDSVMLVVRKGAEDINGDYDKLLQTCSPHQTAEEAQRAGALAVLLYWYDDKYTEAMFKQDDGALFFPMPMLKSAQQGDHIAQLLAQGQQLVAEWQFIPPWRPTDALPFENIADFSGYAPLTDPSTNRIKPDLVAPGYLLSAYSDKKGASGTMDHCAVVRDKGTSMSTPVTTGAAALVRQYFMDGFYPSGAANPADALEPSMALVKAVLIAGTAAMIGYSLADGQRLAPPPSPFQGFGRLDLSRSLPLASSLEWAMQSVDEHAMLAKGTVACYHVQVVASTQKTAPDLIITLVWNDYPHYPGSLNPLVNDLDLTVQGPNDTSLHWGNGHRGGDRINNVEKVIIPRAQPGLYTFNITSHYLYVQALPQYYSIVVLGHIKNLTHMDTTWPETPSHSDDSMSSPAGQNGDNFSPPWQGSDNRSSPAITQDSGYPLHARAPAPGLSSSAPAMRALDSVTVMLFAIMMVLLLLQD